MKHKQFILFFDLQASPRVENKYSLNQTLQKRGLKHGYGFQLWLIRTNDDRSHKCSANDALAFILASDSDSNDSFGDESSLDSSDSHDSEEERCFRGTEVDEINVCWYR